MPAREPPGATARARRRRTPRPGWRSPPTEHAAPPSHDAERLGDSAPQPRHRGREPQQRLTATGPPPNLRAHPPWLARPREPVRPDRRTTAPHPPTDSRPPWDTEPRQGSSLKTQTLPPFPSVFAYPAPRERERTSGHVVTQRTVDLPRRRTCTVMTAIIHTIPSPLLIHLLNRMQYAKHTQFVCSVYAREYAHLDTVRIPSLRTHCVCIAYA